jgi:MFS transporter, DHA1 family, inner membrane transport protein
LPGVRRLYLLIYALVFVDETALLGMIPLLPGYRDRFGLSTAQTGALLAAASLAIVVSSIPAGRLSDRVGARRVTIAAGAIVVVSAAATALAGSFVALLAARAAFGLGSGTIWSAALAWLGDSASDERRPAVLGAVVTTAGVAGLAGPVGAGYLAERVGPGAPWAVVTAIGALVVVGLMLSEPGVRVAHEHRPLRLVVAGMRTAPLLAGATVIMVFGGVADGFLNLLAPLQLSATGMSEGTIGVWLSVAAAVFIAGSAATARLGVRAVSLRAAAVLIGLQAFALAPVLASSARAAVIAMVLMRYLAAALPYTIAYPLAYAGADTLGLGTGTVNGLLGVAWGLGSFVGPPAAGVIADRAGDATAYALLAAFTLVMAVWIMRSAQRAAVPAAASAA